MNPMTNQEQGLKVVLPNGRNVNLSTREGANAFLSAAGNQQGGGGGGGGGNSFEGFSSNLEDVTRLRQKPRPTAQDKFRMYVTYVSFIQIAEHASPEVFETMVPKSELECWFDHAHSVLSTFPTTTNKDWKQRGALQQHDDAFLSVLSYFACHYKAVQVGFEKGVYQSIAAFVESRQAPKLPNMEIAETITHIVNNSFLSYNNHHQGQTEKFWKKLEASGLLRSYIRCSTYPEIQDDALYICYQDLLEHNLPLIKKKFKKGTIGGDTLQAILDRKDGSPQQDPKVLRFLRNMVMMAKDAQAPAPSSSSCPDGPDNVCTTNLRMCRHCDKMESSQEFQLSLMQCARCKRAYYCSKDCQIKDWKSHKATCKPVPTKQLEKHFAASENLVLSFVKSHYMLVVEEILKVMEEHQLSKNEVLLELDFKPDAEGNIPAYKTPPQFAVKNVLDIINGKRITSSSKEPLSIFGSTDPDILSQTATGVKAIHQKMTKNHLLCICRDSNGCSCYRMMLQSRKGGQLFSTGAILAMKLAIHDGNFSKLSRHFDEEQIRAIRGKYSEVSTIPSL